MAETSSHPKTGSGGPRIGFATIGDARGVGAWSGTPYHMARALERRGAEIEFIGPLNASLLTAYKIYARVLKTLGMSRISPVHATPVARQYSADAAGKIRDAKPDLVFAPAGSAFAGSAPRDVPLVYTSDATFQLIDGYHPHYRDMSDRGRRDTEAREVEAIARADLIVYPSDWAARSAIDGYGADQAKVHVAPWGANLENPPTREVALAPRRPGPIRLFLLGVDWVQKGADVAVEALRHLRADGHDVELTVCGCTPPEPIEMEGLTIIPFLRKSDPAEAQRLEELFQNADLFIMPTLADCYGIVFCEAASYGLPSIAPATGGVTDASVRDGVNGLLLPEGSKGRAYADAVAGLIEDPDRLAALKLSARDRFEAELNWDAWADRVLALMARL